MGNLTLDSVVSELELSARAENCLADAKITTIRQLVSLTSQQLLEIKNFGKTSLQLVEHRLDVCGFKFGMPIEPAKIQEIPNQPLQECPECAKLKEKIALMEKWRISKDELDKMNEKIVALEYRINDLEENAEKDD